MRHSLLAWALALGLLGGMAGCRASDSECLALAEHIVGLATAEGRPTSGTAKALEADCVRLRPTSALVECMMEAQTLSALEAC